jgi:hypothetical protein
MNVDTAAAIVTDNKGQMLIVTLTDGSIDEGLAISVNSKGVNLNVDGKVITRALSRVELIETEQEYTDRIDPQGDELGDYADPSEDELDIDEAEDGIGDMDIDDADGMTAAEAAAIFGMPARDLRKVTRSMGLGVGRGRTYLLDSDDINAIRTELKARVDIDATA